MTKTITLRVSPELKERLTERAKESKRTLTNYLNFILDNDKR